MFDVEGLFLRQCTHVNVRAHARSRTHARTRTKALGYWSRGSMGKGFAGWRETVLFLNRLAQAQETVLRWLLHLYSTKYLSKSNLSPQPETLNSNLQT
jgi:hypothetical protein